MSPGPVELSIERLSQLGEGVGSFEGRTVFVAGALPGERVRVRLDPDGKRAPGRAAGGAGAQPRAPRSSGALRGERPVRRLRLAAPGRAGPARGEAGDRPLLAGAPGRPAARVHRRAAAHRLAPGDGYRRRAVLHFARDRSAYYGRGATSRCPSRAVRRSSRRWRICPGRCPGLLAPLAKDTAEVHLLAEGGKAAVFVQLKGAAEGQAPEAARAALKAAGLEGLVLAPEGGRRGAAGHPGAALRRVPARPGCRSTLRPDAFAQAHAGANQALVEAALGLLDARPDGLRAGAVLRQRQLHLRARAGAARRWWRWSPAPVRWIWRSAAPGRLGWRNVRFMEGDVEARSARGSSPRDSASTCCWRIRRAPAPGASASWARRWAFAAWCTWRATRRRWPGTRRGWSRAATRRAALQVVDMFPQTHHVEAVMSFSRAGGA